MQIVDHERQPVEDWRADAQNSSGALSITSFMTKNVRV